ncbi:MAG TPA: SMC family ATPase, partial [Abditibacteriaceae bacterium]
LLNDAETELRALEEATARINELQEERFGHEARLAQLKQLVESEKSQIAANEQKLKVLLANPKAQCPLCESSLGDHGREHIQENIEDEIALGQSRIEELMAEARLVQKKKAALDAPLAEMQGRLRDSQRLNQNAANLRHQWEAARDAGQKSAVLSTQREEVGQQLESGEFAPQLSAQLKTAQAKLETTGYDHDAHEAASARVAELAHFGREIEALRFAQEQIAGAQTRLATLEPQLRELEAELESGAFAREDNVELARLKAQADKLQYDKEARAGHNRARSEFSRLESAPDRWSKLQWELARSADVESSLAAVEKSLAENRERSGALEEEQAGLRDVTAQISECERALTQAQYELREARENEREASTELGHQRATLEACAKQEEDRVRLDDERKAAAREAFILKQTATAFGKDGIQALIIENAIPEIQDDANHILRRLTKNNMQISMESLREKQTGGLKETLDIKISDDRGTREYLMFSGGEAFRADFALRIALSKLLARRAGTQLRTLIIDEGFGTQDADGLQQMIECIQAIADDFSKVLVVTHLETIKNAFPVRIEVTKEPDTGSRYHVLGA